MIWIFVIWVFQSRQIFVVYAKNIEQMPAHKNGCTLVLNNGLGEMEPIGNPLLIHVRFRVRSLKDIPDSGGSFTLGIT